MKKLQLKIKQKREPITQGSGLDISVFYRVTTIITGAYDETNTPIEFLTRLFLYNATATPGSFPTPGKTKIKDNAFLRIAKPEDYQITNPTKLPNFDIPTEYNNLPFVFLDYQSEDPLIKETPTIYPPDYQGSPVQNALKQGEYFRSNFLVTEYKYLADAILGAENIILGLEIFADRYNLMLQNKFSTMNNPNYVNGYEDITID